MSTASLLTGYSLPKTPINPDEFWHSYSTLGIQLSGLFGGLEKLKKIPIFPIEDLDGKLARKFCSRRVTITKIEHPIEIYFDSDGKVSGITIVYRIKLIKNPKLPCLWRTTQRATEMIHIAPQLNTQNSFIFGPVCQSFGPASASHSKMLFYLQTLFTENTYTKTSSCLSLNRSRVSLDT
jgi:hypothetical protein